MISEKGALALAIGILATTYSDYKGALRLEKKIDYKNIKKVEKWEDWIYWQKVKMEILSKKKARITQDDIKTLKFIRTMRKPIQPSKSEMRRYYHDIKVISTIKEIEQFYKGTWFIRLTKNQCPGELVIERARKEIQDEKQFKRRNIHR